MSEETELKEQVYTLLERVTTNPDLTETEATEAILALLTQQYNAGLDAALAALPKEQSAMHEWGELDEQTRKEVTPDELESGVEARNQALQEARESIQQLKRSE